MGNDEKKKKKKTISPELGGYSLASQVGEHGWLRGYISRMNRGDQK